MCFLEYLGICYISDTDDDDEEAETAIHHPSKKIKVDAQEKEENIGVLTFEKNDEGSPSLLSYRKVFGVLRFTSSCNENNDNVLNYSLPVVFKDGHYHDL